MSRDQNAGRNNNVKVHNKSVEMVEYFRYSGTTITTQNSIQQEIKCILKTENACWHAVQNLLSSSLLFKNIQIKIHRTTIYPLVFYGWKTWSLTLREELRYRVFQNSVLSSIFGPKRNEATREWRKLHDLELNGLYSSPNVMRVIESRRMWPVGHIARTGQHRCIQGIGGETYGKETIWKT